KAARKIGPIAVDASGAATFPVEEASQAPSSLHPDAPPSDKTITGNTGTQAATDGARRWIAGTDGLIEADSPDTAPAPTGHRLVTSQLTDPAEKIVRVASR